MLQTQARPAEAAVWPRADLARRLSKALGVARRALPILAEDGYRDESDPGGSFGPDKPLAETAMLLYVASAAAQRAGVERELEALAELLAPLARRDRTAVALAQHPSICLQLAMPHALLNRLGFPDRRFDRLLELGLGSRAHEGREMVPHRELEKQWLRSVWVGAPAGPEMDAAARASVLGHPLDLIWGSREDAYAHTHAFMYFTDFGYASRPMPRPPAEVLGESEAVLARALLLGDFDLSAEVLMAWPMTRSRWSPTATFGLRVLAELEDQVGFLPARNGTPEKFAQLSGRERETYSLAASYHTVYVMGMLCALALRAPDAPPDHITGPAVTDAVVDALLDAIGPDDTPWRRTFDRLECDEQRALGPFLLDLALLSRARDNDFGAVAELLALASSNELADAPLCAQSAELLHRMSVCVSGP